MFLCSGNRGQDETMPEQAKITSVEAIQAFRSALVVYLAQMRPVLEEISSEVLRTRSWLEDDRRRFWLQEMRRRSRQLEDAQQELFTAAISQMGDTKSFQQLAVQKAQREVRAAEEKLGVLKKWDRDLHGFLEVEMERAVAQLDQTIRLLDAYRSVGAQPAQETGGPQ